MADPELNIKIKADSRDARREINQLDGSLRKFSTNIKSLSRDLTILSAGITAAFAGAFQSARKDIPAVDTELKKLTNSFQTIANTVAVAVLPTLKEFNNLIAGVAARFKNLSDGEKIAFNLSLKFPLFKNAMNGAIPPNWDT